MHRHAVLLVLLVALFGSACSASKVPGLGGGEKVPDLAEGTCWTAAALGADRDRIAEVAKDLDIEVAAAEVVMANRPAFTQDVDCGGDHALEVYRLVRLPAYEAKVTTYGDLVRTDQPLYRQLARAVQAACMEPVLARAAKRTRLPGALMEPALPVNMHVTWAPPSPAQFEDGEHGFACVFTQSNPSPLRYAQIFRSSFPTALRTCIVARTLDYVDCARKHERERIAVLQVRQAVLAGAFPGRKAIRNGPRGRYLAASAAKYAALDRACTTYLRSISSTKELTGIAEIDLGYWPAADGSYPIVCEADTRPNRPSVTTRGSVYDR